MFWEHEPLLATDTFQSQIPTPAETDIVVCILWSRLETRLPRRFVAPTMQQFAGGVAIAASAILRLREELGAPAGAFDATVAAPT